MRILPFSRAQAIYITVSAFESNQHVPEFECSCVARAARNHALKQRACILRLTSADNEIGINVILENKVTNRSTFTD